jgi:hypothetical protein
VENRSSSVSLPSTVCSVAPFLIPKTISHALLATGQRMRASVKFDCKWHLWLLWHFRFLFLHSQFSSLISFLSLPFLRVRSSTRALPYTWQWLAQVDWIPYDAPSNEQMEKSYQSGATSVNLTKGFFEVRYIRQQKGMLQLKEAITLVGVPILCHFACKLKS